MSLLGVFIGGVALVAGAAIAVSVIADELSDRESYPFCIQDKDHAYAGDHNRRHYHISSK